MRADRLLSLLMLLQTRGRMTARELAERLEVSERTIYRDLDALSAAGVPIYAERGPGGGCALLNGYQTNLTGLTDAEVQALFLSSITGPLADLGLARALDEAMLKLSAALPETQRQDAERIRQRVHLDTARWDQSREAEPFLRTMREAICQERRLQLTYHELHGAHRELCVEPYGLVAKANAWYLVGMVAGVSSVYHVAHIQVATATEERFTRQEDFDLPLFWADYCARLETVPPRTLVVPDTLSAFPYPSNRWSMPQAASPLTRNWHELTPLKEKNGFNPEQANKQCYVPSMDWHKEKKGIQKKAPSRGHIKKPAFSTPLSLQKKRILSLSPSASRLPSMAA